MTYDEQLTHLRVAEKKTVKEISEIVGRPESTVAKHLRRLGLTDSSGRSDISDEDVLAAWNSGLTIIEIARKFSASHSTITKRLKKFGISCDRASGIRRHFSREHSNLWPDIKQDLDGGMSVSVICRKYNMRQDSVERLIAADGIIAVDVVSGGHDSGPGTLTCDVFVQRSKEVHGDYYDYSSVVYLNNKSKVKIKCPVHGIFEQTPEKHMLGQGCPFCRERRIEATNQTLYGVSRPLQSSDVRDNMIATLQDRYGTDNVMKVDSIKEKHIQTCRKKYGVDFSCEADSVKEKKEQTCMALFGGVSPFCSPAIQERSRSHIFMKYGVNNVMQLPLSVQKIKATCLKKYGVEHVLQLPEFRNKLLESKRKNGTYSSSRPEESMYSSLCSIFGEDDVVRQYSCDRYPFACDFYIKSRDMFIELNGNWTHGRYWFDGENLDDIRILEALKKKAVENPYYKSAVHVWSVADVEKRQYAAQNFLNYLVFWDNKLRDFELWVELGCPDGTDWEDQGSWIPN